MLISDFDYILPEDKIAYDPPKERGASRLLVLNRKTGAIEDDRYLNLPDFLEKGDVLVLNRTKVLKARLFATKEDGTKRELIIIERHAENENWNRHKVLYRGKIRKGEKLFVGENEIFVEEVLGQGLAIVESKKDLLELAEENGEVPLPPYLKREATKDDEERYQTVFAKEIGSVAAPTASLNLTEELLEKIQKRGVKVAFVTLHVGLGTFLPVRVDDVKDHDIHSEYFEIPEDTIEAIKNRKGRVFAIGTTVARTLEYAANNNWPLSGEANIFIYPGYEFKTIDALLTNFHAPRSTVLLLAAAFAGKENLEKSYEHALKNDYKFLSYGDSMLIL